MSLKPPSEFTLSTQHKTKAQLFQCSSFRSFFKKSKLKFLYHENKSLSYHVAQKLRIKHIKFYNKVMKSFNQLNTSCSQKVSLRYKDNLQPALFTEYKPKSYRQEQCFVQQYFQISSFGFQQKEYKSKPSSQKTTLTKLQVIDHLRQQLIENSKNNDTTIKRHLIVSNIFQILKYLEQQRKKIQSIALVKVDEYQKRIRFQYLERNIKQIIRAFNFDIKLIIDLLAQISDSFDVFVKIKLLNLRNSIQTIRTTGGNHRHQIKIKHVNFKKSILFIRQNYQLNQKLISLFMEVFKRERQDIYEILKQMEEDFTEQLLASMYDIFFRQIMKEVIGLIEQNEQKLGEQQQKFLPFLKNLLNKKMPRQQYIKQLQEYQQNVQHSLINRTQNIYTSFQRKQLQSLYQKNYFLGFLKKEQYQNNVVNPILMAQENKRVDVHLGMYKKIISKIKNFSSKCKSNTQEQIFEKMIYFLDKQAQRLNNYLVDQSQLSSIQQKFNHSKRSCIIHFEKQQNVLSASLLAQSNNAQQQIQIDSRKKYQKRDSFLQSESIPNNERINSQHQFLQFLYDQIQSQNIYYGLNKQKFIRIHDNLSKNGFQQDYMLNQLKESKLAGLQYESIHEALCKKFKQIKQEIQSNPQLSQMPKDPKLKCSKLQQKCWQTYSLVAKTFFQNRDNYSLMLYEAFMNSTSLMGEKQWDIFIEKIQSLLQDEKCFVFRKFKEQQILQFFKEKISICNKKSKNINSQKKEKSLQSKLKQEQRSQQQKNGNHVYVKKNRGVIQSVHQTGDNATNTFNNNQNEKDKRQRQRREYDSDRSRSPNEDISKQRRENKRTAKKDNRRG